ncbi:PREDICTED: nuclear receptor 2C2-associated protein, partial [Ceratosolen solmsi marchali]|uniref:Nuclear receptor 2C2-associated protein n=1 Tax=Ceratosolen solmsi marchali TaxID=326594 RepID=A0AAJ6YST5_9HYME
YISRVSSVLNKNGKIYGKQFMFDKNDETCWNSDCGSPQWIVLNYYKEINLTSLEIQFQGGFAGLKCQIQAGSNLKNLNYFQDIFPENSNSIQLFKLISVIKAKIFKLVFQNSTDFFGRIIIYKLLLNYS